MEEQERIYYTNSPGLTLWVGKPRREQVDGEIKTIEPELIQAVPQGRSNWGMLRAVGEKQIAFLEDRRRNSNCKDIFTPEEYNKLSLPEDVRIAQAESESDRLLKENNRLLALLQKQGELKQEARK